MSNPGDNGSWNSQGNDFDAQQNPQDPYGRPPQDPWAQPPADPQGAAVPQEPFAQQDPYGQQGPDQQQYGQPDQYGQQGTEQQQGAVPQDPWAQPPADQQGADQQQYGQPDPNGQQGAAQDPFAQSSAPSASDPYGQGQQGWSPAAGSVPSASDPYGQGTGAAAAGGAGFSQQYPNQAPSGAGQSRLLVGLLGIFLGGFGVHRFLMGYTTIGIIQVAITVLSCGILYPISGIWGLVEGIMVLAKSDAFERDAHGRPLTD